MAEYWRTRGGEQWVAQQDRFDRMLEPCGRRLVEAVSPMPGEHILDVGCGNGATTLEVARRIGPSGNAVGIDLSRAMLATARQRAAESGISATFVEGDAQVEHLGGPFDAALSRFGVMFFDDPAAAFANLAGALRPGGRIGFVCWKEMFTNEWITVPAIAIVTHVGMPELPEPGAPGPFALADAGRIREILDGAGFTNITIDEASDQIVLGDDVDDVVAFLVTDEMGRRALEGKDPDRVEAAIAAAVEALTPFASSEGVAMGSAYWVVTARLP
jgi:SAM-dependent methyltransferase